LVRLFSDKANFERWAKALLKILDVGGSNATKVICLQGGRVWATVANPNYTWYIEAVL